MSDLKKEKQEEGQGAKSLGVLYTGYLEKKNPVSGSFKKRFVVLTQSALHWFKREDGKDLFGEERGQMGLGNVLTVKILDEDATMLEIQGIDQKKRYFRGNTPVVCEEWVSAIRSAVKSHARRPNAARRASLSAQRAGTGIGMNDPWDENNEENSAEKPEVTVSLVSLKSTLSLSEVVVTRNPDWNRVITIAAVRPGDVLILSTSNGGHVSLTYDQIRLRVDDGLDFDVAVQDVPLASSLKISVSLQAQCQDILDRTSSTSKAKQTYLYRLQELGVMITSDRACAISTVLSLLVLMAGFNALTSRSIGPQATLLMLFATALSVYNLWTTLERARVGQRGEAKGLPITLLVHGHTFTSPDAPINDPDSEIPQRFIIGCGHNLAEARRRWEITKHWRETEGVNMILDEPQPYFFLIRTMYPHYHCGRGRQGHAIFYERPGEFQASQLAARGVKTDDLVRHWLFTTEYQWNVLCGNDETAKSIAVIDIEHIKMGDLAGENLTFLKKTIGIANAHYPERSYVIFIVNAPMFFSMLWRIVRPMVDENTQKKIRILSKSETLKGLQEHIDLDQIPDYYGGNLCFKPGTVDSCRHFSPETLAVSDFVRRLNERNQCGNNNASFYGSDALAAAGGDVSSATTPAGSGNSPRGGPSGGAAPVGAAAGPGAATTRVPFQPQESYDFDEDDGSGRRPPHAHGPGPVPTSPRRGSLGAHPASPGGGSHYGGDDWSVASHTTAHTTQTQSTVPYNSVGASPPPGAGSAPRRPSLPPAHSPYAQSPAARRR